MLHLKRKNMDPPGGWVFTAETGHSITAPFFDELVRRAREYFNVNEFPIPDNLDEIVEDQICRRVPADLVVEDIFNRVHTENHINQNTSDLVRRYRQGSCIDAVRILGRIMTCRKCPFNCWRHGCFECGQAYKRVNYVTGEKLITGLYACDIFGALCGALCILDTEVIHNKFQTVPTEEIPPNCWMNTEPEGEDNG